MTRDQDIERVLERWFTEGPTQMPDRLFEYVDHIDRLPQRRRARLMTRFVAMNSTFRLATAAVVILIAGVAGAAFLTRPGVVGTGSSPTLSAAPSVSAQPSPPAVVIPLEGTWATGPIPITDIKASMVAAGIDTGDADAWIAEVGSPTRYSFLLGFTGTTFTHSEETPDMAMQVGEAGTFALTGKQLVLSLGEPGNVDTYTFDATLSDNELSLRCVDSTEQGTAEDKAKHRRYTIAFYCSAPFRRQP